MPRTAATTATALATTLALTLTACSTPRTPHHDEERPLVLTTFTVLADMTRNIAGNRLQVASLTRPGAEIHGYEPTPDDLVRGNEADLILQNGLGLETWLTQFTDQIHAPTHTLTEGIDTIPITSGNHQGQPNPHAWMSPDNGPTYVDNIQKALTELDPEGAHHYEQTAQNYKTDITQVGTDLHNALTEVPEHTRALVTCEGAFSYLARDTGLTETYLWPTNAENEGTPQQIASVTQFVEDNDIPTVFCETTVNDSAQQAVAHDTGAHMGEPLYVDSLSPPEGPVPTYLDLLRHDAQAITQGLTPTQPPNNQDEKEDHQE
ncbi:metal ABC transporter substrate-binding protein [Nocardiopsis kunsanensis]|uniref:Metal ABC transporter substrate-binding protein n=1 Tax=Nocardiopsis kunsanensis TaxID=141693 RepID=A0A919CGU8_9ACTN|nr:metal ABC transporter substrate-binding protein [Nocardiopsis kunsanensis]GHD19693.1 metal ABC transporter substrate-binding protein [Nocardiopsis kunsanensis]